jgi:NAD(P)-dependent dehydrogenase (short-subunit alcohol dehydrogenase family)
MRNFSSAAQIINVAPIAGQQQPFPGWGAYSVSKAGLIRSSPKLSAEERQNGIRVVSFLLVLSVNTSLSGIDTVQADSSIGQQRQK